MSPSDPHFLYMILVLPSLFGFTLVGDGFNKIIHDESGGFLSIFFGLVFIGIVVFTYFFFTSYLNQQI